MKHLVRTLLVTLLVLSLLPICALAEGETVITILGTSDLHGNIWGYAYEDNKETTNNGMARQYTYIQQVRAENPNTILIDCGDSIQGTIMTDDLFNKYPEKVHPMMTVMNYMGFDAMTLGNHEFNWGVTSMKQILSTANFPVLAQNARTAEGDLMTGKGWTIVERGGVRVAIIGVTNPNVPIWDGGKDGIDTGVFEAAGASVKAAIAEIGDAADLIVVAAHMGLFAEFDEDGGADAAAKIIEENPEVDALLVGHFHSVVNEKRGDVVVGAPRNGGRDVVRFDLTVDASGKLVDAKVEVVDMAAYEPAAEIREIPEIAAAHQETIDFIAGTGADGEEGGAALGSTTAKFQPVDEIRGIPAGRVMDTAVMDLINMIQLEASGADVSAAALFRNDSDLPEGPINYGNIFSIYKFDNTLYRVKVTGAELKAYMEWSAACYNQWVPGDINISFDPDHPDYLYDMFAGVDYEIDLSQPAGSRIKNVIFKGEPLADDTVLTLAVNNYRYSSALKSQGIIAGSREWESSNSIRDMIVAYFAEHSPVAPVVDNNWRIVGVDLQLDNPLRAELIEKINAGEIETPYSKALNINDYTAE